MDNQCGTRFQLLSDICTGTAIDMVVIVYHLSPQKLQCMSEVSGYMGIYKITHR